MLVNEKSILSKLGVYMDSDKCQTKKVQYVNEVMSGKRDFSNKKNGSIIPTPEIMNQVAEFLIEIIKSQVLGEYYIDSDSVRSLILDDLKITSKIIDAGRTSSGVQLYQLYIGFRDEHKLFRHSLKKKDGSYTGDGIDNIVSLFDTGYSASNYVYGYWYKSSSAMSASSEYIRSLPYRDGLGFMSEAISKFNTEYGDRYNCHAEISDDNEYYFKSAMFQ